MGPPSLVALEIGWPCSALGNLGGEQDGNAFEWLMYPHGSGSLDVRRSKGQDSGMIKHGMIKGDAAQLAGVQCS